MSSQAPTKEISPKLRKTIEKLQTKIKTSPDYEVHQELKAVANRFGSPIIPSLFVHPFPQSSVLLVSLAVASSSFDSCSDDSN